MAKEVKKEVIEEVAVEVNEAEQTAEPEKKEEEKKSWKQKRQEKKAKFEAEHPVAAKRIKVAKTFALGATAGFVAKIAGDAISSAISGKNSGLGTGSDVIDVQYTDITNNDSNN